MIPPTSPSLPLNDMLVGAPLDRLVINIMGPFPESTHGNKYVFAVTNYFVKWVEIFAVPNQSDVICMEVILNVVI